MAGGLDFGSSVTLAGGRDTANLERGVVKCLADRMRAAANAGWRLSDGSLQISRTPLDCQLLPKGGRSIHDVVAIVVPSSLSAEDVKGRRAPSKLEGGPWAVSLAVSALAKVGTKGRVVRVATVVDYVASEPTSNNSTDIVGRWLEPATLSRSPAAWEGLHDPAHNTPKKICLAALQWLAAWRNTSQA
jgi:hypothetical protein